MHLTVLFWNGSKVHGPMDISLSLDIDSPSLTSSYTKQMAQYQVFQMSTDFWKLRLKDRNIRIVTKLRFWKDVALYKEEVINDTTHIFCPHYLTMQADKNFNFIKTTIIQKKPDKCLFLKFRYLYYVILPYQRKPLKIEVQRKYFF